MLFFPSLDTLKLVLTSGALTAEVSSSPAVAVFDALGSVRIQPSRNIPRSSLNALRRLDVTDCDPDGRPGEAVDCWAQILPLVPEPLSATPGSTTPVIFEIPGRAVAEIVGEILRLGNDRQSLRWLTSEDDPQPFALLRVVGPPFYTLLRAIDHEIGTDRTRAYVEKVPRVFVELGYTHPLVEGLRPQPDRLLFLGAPRSWTFLDEGPFRDVYETLDFRLPAGPVRWKDASVRERFSVPMRLVRGETLGAAELWVLTDRSSEQLDNLVRHADDRLLARLAFAVAEAIDEPPKVVLRVRPSKEAPPVLVVDGIAFQSYQHLRHLFLPVGTRLHPPIRRDVVSRLLAADSSSVTWLEPDDGGAFVPESLPDDSFRPLDQWVEYVLDREHKPLRAWVRAFQFEFEPFICTDDTETELIADSRPKLEGANVRPEKATDLEMVERPIRTKPKSRARKIRPDGDSSRPHQPAELVKRLNALEAEFLALEAPLDAPERSEIWNQMARLNSSLGRMSDAAICWSSAIWETDEPPKEWLEKWASAEVKASNRDAGDPHWFDRLIGEARPSAPDLRSLATFLLQASHARSTPPSHTIRLDRVQRFLELHEGLLPVRVAWLAWCAVAKLAGGDVLALAQARDRTLERLHENGLRRDLDLAAFLRFNEGDAGERARAAIDQMVRLHADARAWNQTGSNNGPYTGALIDLMFSYGLARLGASEPCGSLLQSGLAALPKSDSVVLWLGSAFDYRIRQALEGKSARDPLPDDLLRGLELTPRDGEPTPRRVESIDRFKIDRLRAHSRILEPYQHVAPYRRWQGSADDLTLELARAGDVVDRGELAQRIEALLARRPDGDEAALREAEILETAIEVAFRLGDSFARQLFDRILPIVDRLNSLSDRVNLLERALRLAVHFDHAGHARASVARSDGLLLEADELSAVTLEPLVSQCFRGLRKLGLHAESNRFLERIAERLLKAHGIDSSGGLTGKVARHGKAAIVWSKTLRLLLHVAPCWYLLDQIDSALPIYHETRALLLEGDLPPIDQTALACTYAVALAPVPAAMALPRLEELFQVLERVHDSFTVTSHYSLSRLRLVESVVLTLASDEFTLGQRGRRWLEDDEYFVRRRIHRDVRAALAEPSGHEAGSVRP